MKFSVKDYFSTEFIKFLAVSTVAAGVNFVSRIIIDLATGYAVAIVLAYIVGMVTAFLLNRAFVFKGSTNRTRKQFVVFTIVNVLAILQTLIVSLLLRDFLFPVMGFTFYPEEVAHIIGLGVPALTSYIGHKYFSFKK